MSEDNRANKKSHEILTTLLSCITRTAQRVQVGTIVSPRARNIENEKTPAFNKESARRLKDYSTNFWPKVFFNSEENPTNSWGIIIIIFFLSTRKEGACTLVSKYLQTGNQFWQSENVSSPTSKIFFFGVNAFIIFKKKKCPERMGNHFR